MIQKHLKNDWNPGTWVIIREYSVRAILWIPTWQGLEWFSRFCIPLLLPKVASAFEGLRCRDVIVCLTQVWQSLLPLFCDKTFEFAIQTWQTSLEHCYLYVQTYFLSQLLKMLILLISSYCKMCTLPTLQSRVSVCCEQYKHARS